MNKAELVEEIYARNDCTKTKCREIIDTFLELVETEVSNGGLVRLVNFGTFKPRAHKSTTRFHPQTGKKIEVEAKVLPKFSPGKGFSELVKDKLEVDKEGGYRRK